MPTEPTAVPLISIRHGAALRPTLSGWILCVDGEPATDADTIPPDLAELAAKLPAPTSRDRLDVAIVDRTHPRWYQATCPIASQLFDVWIPLPARGQWELAQGYASGHNHQLVGLWAGQEASPTLAEALHRLYGTQLELAPKKPEPPKPSELTVEQRRAERKHRALVQVAVAITNTQPGEREMRRAEMLLSAVKDFLGE